MRGMLLKCNDCRFNIAAAYAETEDLRIEPEYDEMFEVMEQHMRRRHGKTIAQMFGNPVVS